MDDSNDSLDISDIIPETPQTLKIKHPLKLSTGRNLRTQNAKLSLSTKNSSHSTKRKKCSEISADSLSMKAKTSRQMTLNSFVTRIRNNEFGASHSNKPVLKHCSVNRKQNCDNILKSNYDENNSEVKTYSCDLFDEVKVLESNDNDKLKAELISDNPVLVNKSAVHLSKERQNFDNSVFKDNFAKKYSEMDAYSCDLFTKVNVLNNNDTSNSEVHLNANPLLVKITSHIYTDRKNQNCNNIVNTNNFAEKHCESEMYSCDSFAENMPLKIVDSTDLISEVKLMKLENPKNAVCEKESVNCFSKNYAENSSSSSKNNAVICEQNLLLLNNASQVKLDSVDAESHSEINFELKQSDDWLMNMDWNMTENDCKMSLDVLLSRQANEKELHCSSFTSEKNVKNCDKFRIISIVHNVCPNEVVLKLQNVSDKSDPIKFCTLRGFWVDSLFHEGDIVHILSPFVSNQAVIDNNSGFLVTNPDFLLSSTAIVSTMFCMRKAALTHKYRYWCSQNKIMLIGSLVHQLFQQSVNDAVHSEKEIYGILNRILQRTENLISMCSAGVTEAVIMQELSMYVSSILLWINTHRIGNEVNKMQVVEVRDIEDNVWCPRYGIKGKIDMTVEVKFPNNQTHKLMPLELKTGRPSFSPEHEGQVNLYTLMMEDRMSETSDGLLLYLKNGPQMKLIPASHDARRGLIQLRNELAHYTVEWADNRLSRDTAVDESSLGNCYLPEPINNKKLCQKCPYILPCTLYQRAYNNTHLQNTEHAMFNLVSETTYHLSESHLKHFQHWSYLLSLESSCDVNVKSFWNEDACSREEQEMCLSNMILCTDILTQQEKEGGVYIHTFMRSPNCSVKSKSLSAVLCSGDYIIISNQENRFEVAIATGYILSVNEKMVEVSIERDLQQVTRYSGYIFRLDKHFSNNAGSSIHNNLMKLMLNNERSAKLRNFVIDKREPAFLSTLSKSVVTVARPFLKSLNKPQRKAVFKALMMQDYMLIKGMPGTGKTATIVALIRLMVKMGLSVLLTSYTHSAVDNVLLKLLPHDVDFVRIGQIPRIHRDIQPFSFENLTKHITTVNELNEFIQSKMVIATTCLGVNHAMLTTRTFDVCIVDEASQVIQPACLGPLFYANKFVLAGDPKQLPPVVRSEKAKIKGMQESLFCQLESPTNCMELYLQYRMNQEIMYLCNCLTYNGALECGTPEIASAVLQLNTLELSIPALPEYKWISSVMENSLLNSVVFLNTDLLPATESCNERGNIKNDIEVELVSLLIHFFLKGGLSSEDIGIITPYRCQVELLKSHIHKLTSKKIEINTVDQYQGRDKDAIIISCVRSTTESSQEKSGDIIADEKRLNVALSRAKKKLIIIGSKSTLSRYKPFQKLFHCLRVEQIHDLPQDAKKCSNDFKLLCP